MAGSLAMAAAGAVAAPSDLEARLRVRLFHALGGNPAWFRQRAYPRLLALLDEVAARKPPSAAAERALHFALAAAAEAAEALTADAAGMPAAQSLAVQRLERACRAARLACQPPPCRPDPLGAAARRLVSDGIWSLDSRTGRWFRVGSEWALLWPLAGRDLLAAVSPQDLTDWTLAGVLSGLACAGYLCADPSSALVPALRRDGRRLKVALVTQSFAQRSGFAGAGEPSVDVLRPAGGPIGE